MAEGKKSFVLYTDIIHTVKKLPREKQGELFVMILDYVNDLNPTTDDLLVDIAFEPIKQGIIEGKKRMKLGHYHWNYKGGISDENKSIRNSAQIKYWRIKVFERDNYTCRKCGIKGGTLHAHHILPFAKFPEFRTEIGNGLTLCKSCHFEEHKLK